jgi:ribosomal protein S18 acetylase RimI-like enzyme
MCLDLVARHFSSCSTETVMHSKASEDTRFTDAEGVSWLFLSQALSLDPQQSSAPGESQEKELNELLQIHTSAPKWTMNTLHKNIVSNAVIGKLIAEGKASIDMLYSMFWEPSQQKNPISSTTPEGWYVKDGNLWFEKEFSAKANLVTFEKVLIAVDSQGTVGGFISTIYDPTPINIGGKPRSRIYVSDLLVFPPFRRQGLAKALLRSVFSGARVEDEVVVCLTVFCENLAAVTAYFREDFRVDQVLWVVRNL